MRNDKNAAISLRKQGKSYRQIRSELKIPLSTLSDWFSGIEWSKNVAKRLAAEVQKVHTARLIELDKVRGARLTRVYEEAKAEARAELESYKYNPLFIAGLMLYWGEGDKLSKYAVKLTNTDPEMIRLFVFFLTEVCRIPSDKISFQVIVYPDLNEPSCKRFWALASGLAAPRFIKSSTIQGKHSARRLPFGICMVTVSSAYLKVKILEWLRVLPAQLMDKRYYENITGEAAIV